ncbi:MAG: glycosyltransferase family 39 protein, partial [Anaerolineae bacterium]
MDGGTRPVAGIARWEIGALAAILLIATLTRTLGLGRVPPGLSADELANSRMAELVLNGERPIWFEDSFGHEPLYHYLQAVTMRLFGFNVWGVVLPSVVAGVLAASLAYAFGRRVFGRGVGLVAAAGLAVTWWPIFFSRVGLRIVGLAPLAAAMASALWRGGAEERGSRGAGEQRGRGAEEQGRRGAGERGSGALWWSLLGGLLLAAGLYTYSA